ncbi:hypothetical protein BIY23_03285 [Wolbachia pipientis]|uniref:Uncharacterized protein n=1 Tax=Wolbachia pipientis TaxID=955 RepID=A0A1E7QJB7_WOLPI|nr:TRP75-related protein [Wolbachia pipientis]OEY86560.1 hypothetical protein BIY23_03285 [Wolbachia pipientis]
MLRIILFVLIPVFLMCGFAESKSTLSKKYTPHGNPGGRHFEDDKDFAKLYKLYEKRKKLLISKKKPQPYKTKEQNDASSGQGGCIVNDKQEDAMVNKHGINLTRLKDAVFIDNSAGNRLAKDQEIKMQEIKQDEQEQKTVPEQQESAGQEKKVSTMNITVKDASSRRRTCLHDPIIDK